MYIKVLCHITKILRKKQKQVNIRMCTKIEKEKQHLCASNTLKHIKQEVPRPLRMVFDQTSKHEINLMYQFGVKRLKLIYRYVETNALKRFGSALHDSIMKWCTRHYQEINKTQMHTIIANEFGNCKLV